MKPFICSPFGVFFFFLLVSWKVLFVVCYKYPLDDNWHQQTLAINFANGFGVNYITAPVHNLSGWAVETIYRWPPATASLTGLLLTLTKNIETAVHLVDGIALFFLLSAIRSVVKILNFTGIQQWLLWLLLFFNPALTDLFGSSDLLSLASWLWSFYYTLRLASEPQNKKLLVPLIVLGFLPAVFRYQFYVLIFCLPLTVLFWSYRAGNQLLLKKSMLWLAGTALLLALQWLFIKHSGAVTNPITDTVAFSPENLSRINAFFISAFVPFYQFLNFFSAKWGINVIFLYQVTGAASLLLFCFFLYQLFRSSSTVAASFLKFISLSAVSSVFFFLCFLSLIYEKQVNGRFTFTYVQEPRYWGIAIMLIPVLSIAQQPFQKKRFSEFIIWCCISVSAFVSLYRVQKTFFQKDALSVYTQRILPKKKINLAIQTTVAARPLPVVISCFDKDYAMGNYNQPYAVVANDSLLTSGTIQSAKPVWLFLITKDTLSEKETRFVTNNHMLLMERTPGIYRLYRNN
ncbi:MAG: hypothetical protein K2X48_05630 [Chitinophagaceae bacterium]|nr:hypothetical protein [Chitinophagaceae bacterium]